MQIRNRFVQTNSKGFTDSRTGKEYILSSEEDSKEMYLLLNDVTSDLYDYQLLYNVLLFNDWNSNKQIEVYKTRRDHNGEKILDGNHFIVIAVFADGTYIGSQYDEIAWDFFRIPSCSKARHDFNERSNPIEVLQRIINNGYPSTKVSLSTVLYAFTQYHKEHYKELDFNQKLFFESIQKEILSFIDSNNFQSIDFNNFIKAIKSFYQAEESELNIEDEFRIENNGIWQGSHQLTWGELCDVLNALQKKGGN